MEAAKQKTKVTPEFIQAISAKLMKTTGAIVNALLETFDTSKGEYRKCAVSVGDRYFVAFDKIPEKVKELYAKINNKMDTVKTNKEKYFLAFDAHYKLVSIHPFGDGNGRTSRLLMNYILAYYNLPLACVYKENKADYFKALEECRKSEPANLNPIREFLFKQQEKYFIKEINKFLDKDLCR